MKKKNSQKTHKRKNNYLKIEKNSKGARRQIHYKWNELKLKGKKIKKGELGK